MAEEKIFTIPLWHKVAEKKARQKRTPYAIGAIRGYLEKYTGAKTVKLGRHLNEAIWAGGKKHPPHDVRVTAVVDGGVVKAELFGQKYEEFKALSVAKREKLVEKLKSRLSAKEQQAQELDRKIEGTSEPSEQARSAPASVASASAKSSAPFVKPAPKPATSPASKPIAKAPEKK
jgi:ribosomal protein L31E